MRAFGSATNKNFESDIPFERLEQDHNLVDTARDGADLQYNNLHEISQTSERLI